ncbi:LysR family transcriptional regulator [Microbacterium betulae]|uniref:LysR family transcriptional regulator n=1 Tax=Microbacterium betulae TaxID=2981139 RepID=A0AA97FHT9_9MICO|nr:LysR family transcriptional regulator [Microbacterium sp. AB]WOF22565.1 LysR family transcriptional regulator [Microbacterium sp. AB]
MELRDLECIVVLADELHFGRAAARLGIAQPPLTKRIQKLEAELGLELFDRSSHRVELTMAGAELVAQARRVVSSAERTRAVARGLRTGVQGVVRIAAVGSAFYEAVPRVLEQARAVVPNVQLQVDELETTELIEALRFGDIQLGLLRPPATHGLATQTVWLERFVVAVGSSSPFAARADISVEDLVGADIVFFERSEGPGYWDRVAALFHAHGVEFQPTVPAPHVTTMVGLVALGVGVSIVPESARRLTPPGVTYLRLRENATLPLAIAARADRLTRPAQMVLDAMPTQPLRPLWPF